MHFINEQKINDILEAAQARQDASAIIDKALGLGGLSTEEAAVLLQCDDEAILDKLFVAARKVKEEIYGKRLVLFAPLYISNVCTNNCLYCAFRADNKELQRKSLSKEEIKHEVEILLSEGHKRLLLVSGEGAGEDYLEMAVKTVYETEFEGSNIRRVNVNAAPMSVEDFKKLKKTNIGTFQLFQETYHFETYQKMHPSGPKSDYEYRLLAMDRAFEAGINDLGIGVLFGLYDYKFEVLALLEHSKYLEKKFGAGPHTISVPRIEPAFMAPAACDPPAPVFDQEFKKLVAILRLAVPYTGLILSTRERPEFRDEVFALGISQISAGSRTDPGGYSEEKDKTKKQQFELSDDRSLAEIIRDIAKVGYCPSFCTACYRLGRTGADFMDLAKPGLIKNFCLPNALLTYKEYLLDFGKNNAMEMGERVIAEQLKDIPDEKIRIETIARLKELEQGRRDLYF